MTHFDWGDLLDLIPDNDTPPGLRRERLTLFQRLVIGILVVLATVAYLLYR